uniref:Uncharacterized protein n=1 Tax=Rhizophora mucronata TaxID=61149 RepID=A0A2P2P3X2_RHIMU
MSRICDWCKIKPSSPINTLWRSKLKGIKVIIPYGKGEKEWGRILSTVQLCSTFILFEERSSLSIIYAPQKAF